MEPYTDIITGSSYIQVGQARLSNGIFWCLRSSLLLCMLLGRVLLISGNCRHVENSCIRRVDDHTEGRSYHFRFVIISCNGYS